MTAERRRKWLGRLGWTLAFVAVFFGVRAWQQSGLPEGRAPPLAGLTLAGENYDLRQASGVTLVYFWATWCPACRLEQGAVDSVARDHALVTVALQSGTPPEVQRYLAEHGLGWRTLNDPAGRIAHDWGVRVTPTFFVVDRAGQIRYRETGYTTALGLRLRLWLAGRS
jgi:thiol-disulfide isomerase/thioredoxin